jgi:hypothetical protein
MFWGPLRIRLHRRWTRPGPSTPTSSVRDSPRGQMPPWDKHLQDPS